MYSTKTYSVKPLATIEKEITLLSCLYPDAKRFFIGDGDLFSVDKELILDTLRLLKKYFPKLTRIASYASTRELIHFSVEDLKEIRSAGLSLLYVGLESGNDEVLRKVDKGVTSKVQLDACLNAKAAGFKLSVMILNGLGGKHLSDEHAKDSAKLLNAIQPELLAILVISFPYGLEYFLDRMKGEFEPMSQLEMLKEMRQLLSLLELESTVFRSDHASNYLVFKGGLNRDKEKFIHQLDDIIAHTIHVPRKPYINESRTL
jgi:radical SAM superfamily enzyme YgiQ (UPF0313 family)